MEMFPQATVHRRHVRNPAQKSRVASSWALDMVAGFPQSSRALTMPPALRSRALRSRAASHAEVRAALRDETEGTCAMGTTHRTPSTTRAPRGTCAQFRRRARVDEVGSAALALDRVHTRRDGAQGHAVAVGHAARRSCASSPMTSLPRALQPRSPFDVSSSSARRLSRHVR